MTAYHERLRVAAALLRTRVAAAADDFSTAADPATGETWAVGQVLAHCAELLPYWRGQAQLVIDAGGGPFGRVETDPGRIAAIERDRRTVAEALLGRVDAGVADVGGWHAARGPEELAVVGRHETLGEMSVDRIVEHFCVEHLEEHAQQLGGEE